MLERKCAMKKNQNFGATTTGSFIMITHPPTRPWKPESLWLTTTWLSSPSSLFARLIPLWFRFVSQIDIQRESQAVLDSINENDFHGAFEVWKKW
jgi:hypothetical protein